jgi:hypothetical protein
MTLRLLTKVGVFHVPFVSNHVIGGEGMVAAGEGVTSSEVGEHLTAICSSHSIPDSTESNEKTSFKAVRDPFLGA